MAPRPMATPGDPGEDAEGGRDLDRSERPGRAGGKAIPEERPPHRVGSTGGHAAALSLNQDSSARRVAGPKRFVF